MEERQIWIKDLLYRILCGWRLIVIAALIGALLLNGLGFMKATKRYQAKLSQQENSSAEQVQDRMKALENSMAPAQVAKVKALAAYILDCQNSSQSLADYMASSIRYQVDPNNVPTMELQFFVDSHYETTYPVISKSDHTNDIMVGLENIVISDASCRAMAQAISSDLDTSYFRELVETVHEFNVLRVKVIADNQANCEKLADVIEATVAQQAPSLEQTYGNFSVSLADRTYVEKANPDLMKEHMTTVDMLEDLYNYIAKAPTDLSDDEEAYYNLLIEGEDNTASAQTQELVRPGFIYLKYIVLGMAVGFIFACAYLYLKVIVSGMMLSPKDCGSKVLAVLPADDQKHRPFAFVDSWLLKLLYGKELALSKDSRMDMVVSAANVAMEKGGMQHVMITGTCADEQTQNAKAAIFDKISGQVAKITLADSALTEPAVLATLSEADGVIIVEHLGVSNYSDIMAQKAICAEHNVPVIGCVVLR